MSDDPRHAGRLPPEQLALLRSSLEMIKADAEFAYRYQQLGEEERAFNRLIEAVLGLTRVLEQLLPDDRPA